ncbi:peptidoglycan editing factor PgeF [Acinetobacter sp. GFQ9D192M]|uniref:Purine nucleoside phosphorylase n=1 Tax=Acinetobacter variabilis TaxID=70346 RepID=A0A7T7WHE2_9GAMM|nr:MULTISPECIES: peptidoglycan editing factor PgeF [Acinetobacter]NHB63950.1 peptidoglycan editing factor PgeF [Acinetobacter sp. GFQ9D191M]NHC00859.1 peptidoglycan editing factor PgeF [Acinetobacter sp. GFQ9D192M]QQN87389.1 peptidoglycan editing factor PgeF [Acinetobacter variabilis]
MQFVQGLPQGVYVGQTRVHHEQVQPSAQPELAGFNLALHVNDDAARVQKHRIQLLKDFQPFGVDKITWMTQTHSTICHTINEQMPFEALVGDGLVTQRKAHALMMMTADCLPVVLGNAEGTEVANLHAGWRGLAGGIVENTIAAMQSKPTWAWLGAAISQPCFEIGSEVKEAFCSKYPELDSAFQAGEQARKYYADLYAIARYILQQQGVETVLGGDQCSYRQADEYFSYRREAKTGRMATFVFMA